MASPALDPYWWEAAPLRELPEAPLPAKVDVAVVGAGFTGLSAALTLARGGRSVAVLEQDRAGEGASSRNGGIASGNLRMGFGAMIGAFGLDRAKQIYGEGIAARRDLARFIDEEGIECQYAPVGRFTGAMRPADYEDLARNTELLNRHLDFGAVMVPRSEQHAEVGTDLYHGGMLRPDIGGLQPALLHRGMLDRAIAAGAEVHTHTAVEKILRGEAGFILSTPRGPVAAKEVVVATNGYTGAATPWLRRRVMPIPSQIIATGPLDRSVMDRLMPKRRMLGETRNLYHYYRPSPDGTRIVFGGRAGADTDDPIEKMRHLRRNLVELFPELSDVEITHSWWGYTGYTFDFMPKLARHEGVHYAAGFCGSGVVWARWIGTKVAQRILGDAAADTAFGAFDFQTRPLYWGKPWFLPIVVAWYGMRDRLGR